MRNIPLPGEIFAAHYCANLVGLSQEEYEHLWTVMHKLGYSDFLSDEQGLITLRFLNGENVFGVIPTAGGKSFTFQTVARMSEDGLTIIITPLIALMRDQTRPFKDGAALFYNSSLSPKKKAQVKRRIREGKLKLLFISPEQLKSPGFKDILYSSRKLVQRFVVDEAHCVIQWGYGFRVKYLHIGKEIKKFERRVGRPIPVLLLTATATPSLQQEIADNLQIKIPDENFVTKLDCADRPELVISMHESANDRRKILWLARQLKLGGRLYNKRGIIFSAFATATTNDKYNVERICQELQESGVKRVGFYHGQMPPAERHQAEQRFLNGEIRILVATKAFGMGMDIEKLEFIIHFYPPLSIEDYWQEAGRGGRGMNANEGEYCDCVVLYRPEDTEYQLLKNFTNTTGFAKTLSTFTTVATGEMCWDVRDQYWKARTGQLRRLLDDLRKHGYVTRLPAMKIGGTRLVCWKLLKPTHKVIEHIKTFLNDEKRKRNRGVKRLLSILQIRASRKGKTIQVKHSTEDSPMGLDHYDKELNWFTEPDIAALEMVDDTWDENKHEYYSQFRLLKERLTRRDMIALRHKLDSFREDRHTKLLSHVMNGMLNISGLREWSPKSYILHYLGLQDEL